MNNQKTEIKGVIAWFASNSVAANLLMLLILAAGLFSYFTIRKSIMPQIEIEVVQISMPYLGAAPEEVEEGVVVRIEEVLQDLKGIKQMNSFATEGFGQVTLEIETGYDLDTMVDQIKGRVDTISTFPEQTERPVIEKAELQIEVMWISVYGDMDPRAHKEITSQIRDELLTLPQVTSVELLGSQDYEIAIEVSEDTLRQYSLTMNEIAAAVRNASVDMPGGTIKTEVGDILLRTKGQVYTGREFSNIALRSYPDGTRLLLGDIANIKDGFVETEGFARFNGKKALNLRVLASGDQNVLKIDDVVQAYIADKKQSLPANVQIDEWGNAAFYLNDRLSMMFDNMFLGAALVLLILAIFLRLRLALWVMVGIPISFLGAIWVMPMDFFGIIPAIDINFISLFGFILVLGIVVDDAIIIGESIYTEISENGHTLDNVIIGAKRVAIPATFGVLTTIAAFAPLLMITGPTGAVFAAIGVVVVLCLVFSLVESKWILPAHLAHMKFDDQADDSRNFFTRLQRGVSHRLHHFIDNIYLPFLKKSIKNRYTTLSVFVGMMILSIGLVSSNWLKFEFFPETPSDFVQVNLSMNQGTPPAIRNAALLRLEDGLHTVEAAYLKQNEGEEKFLKHVLTYTNGDLGGGLVLELTKPEEREIQADLIADLWRDEVGHIAGSQELRYIASDSTGGSRINFQLYGTDYEQMDKAAKELEQKLSEYDGVYDIRNSYTRGSEEIQLKIKPEAELLNVTMSDLARQVRQAFYGEEAQRIQRGRDELRVMVRYPREGRASVADLENMRIRTPNGDEIPFDAVAEVSFGTGYATIRRVERKRSVSITADTDAEKIQSGVVIQDIENNYIPQLLEKYPGVSFGLQGASLEQNQLQQEIMALFGLALFLIYGLLAIPLRSYAQPLIIMMVIPFGYVGAVIGHILLGHNMSVMSLFGLVALSGVIINDGLILVDFVNKARAAGSELLDAVIQAGRRRFRAILLTTLTTFFGVLPILFETSLQAQYVIPMALSLAFGILFGTIITLLLIPSLYLILDDIGRGFRSLFRKKNAGVANT